MKPQVHQAVAEQLFAMKSTGYTIRITIRTAKGFEVRDFTVTKRPSNEKLREMYKPGVVHVQIANTDDEEFRRIPKN